MDITKEEMLQFALQKGMIDVEDVLKQIEIMKRNEILEKHPYKIWQGVNGYWYTYLPKEDGSRELKKKNTLEKIEKLIIDFYKTKDENPTINELFYLWINEKMRYKEISIGTYNRYEVDFIRLYKNSYFANCKIKNITEQMLTTFIRETICDHELTYKAYSNFKTILKGIYKYAKRNELTTFSISTFLGDIDLAKNAVTENPKKEEEDEVFSEEEILLIKDYMYKNIDISNLGLLLMFETGVRGGELAAIKKSDIILVPNCETLYIRRQEIRYVELDTRKTIHSIKDYPKTKAGFRGIILSQEAIEIINMIFKLNPNGEFLLEQNGTRHYAQHYNMRLIKICEKLGINKRSAHKIRKTFGSTLLNNLDDDALVAKQMGHSDINVTLKYYCRNIKTKARQNKVVKNALATISREKLREELEKNEL